MRIVRPRPQTIEMMKRLYAAGYSAKEIGETLGLGYWVVLTRLTSLGVIRRQRTLTQEEKEEIVRLYELGAGAPTIAKNFHVCRSTIYLTLKKLCAEIRPQVVYNRHPEWEGGRAKGSEDYILILLPPGDPYLAMANSRRYVPEHRLVMAKHLGRCLFSWEIVHHKGDKYPQGSVENKQDNRIENLELLPSSHQHNSITRIQTHIAGLKQRIEEQEKMIKLLQWQIKELNKKDERV